MDLWWIGYWYFINVLPCSLIKDFKVFSTINDEFGVDISLLMVVLSNNGCRFILSAAWSNVISIYKYKCTYSYKSPVDRSPTLTEP